MAVKDYSGERGNTRAGKDRERHREMCEEAIRKGLASIVATQDIIGQKSGGKSNKKLSLRVKAYPEYRFGWSRKSEAEVGSGAASRGKTFKGGGSQDGTAGGAGGNQPGEDVYEIEVTLDDINNFLFDDLELPDFLVKQLRQTPIIERGGMTGLTKSGPQSRLHRRGTVRARLHREQAVQHEGITVEAGYVDADLRFRRMSERTRFASNAVLICMMDVSGSMDDSKKFLARAFFWLLNQFVQSKYETAELVFITHHVTAREVEESDFFHTRESGGTVVSSAFELASDVIANRYPPENWNVYAFHCSDGDNWGDDNEHVKGAVRKLLPKCNLIGYVEVDSEDTRYFPELRPHGRSELFDVMAELARECDNVGVAYVSDQTEIYSEFRNLMTRDKEKGTSHVTA